MNYRRLLGVLFGAIIAIEGILMVTKTTTLDIPGVGIVLPRMTMIAGGQLAILGVASIVCWLALGRAFTARNIHLSNAIMVLGHIAPCIVLIEGLFIALNARSFIFEGNAELNPVDIGLLSVQLFMLGAIGLALWVKRDMRTNNYLFWFLGTVSSIFLIGFGVLLIGCSAEVQLENLTVIPSSTITLGGAAMVLFGIITFASWSMTDSKYYQDGYRWIIDIVFALISLLVIVFSVMMTLMTDDFHLGDFFEGKKTWFAYWSTLLFFFGALSLCLWIGKKRKLVRRNLFWFIGSFTAILFPTEGILIMGLSGETIVQGVGIIYDTNALLIGYPFIALGINLILAWHIYNNEYFRERRNRDLLDMMFLFCQALLFLGGLMIISRASTLIMDDIGTLSDSVVMLMGAQVATLGLICLLCWIMRKDGSSPKMRRVSILGLLFLILLVPPAIIL